jgi:hypothetical protein
VNVAKDTALSRGVILATNYELHNWISIGKIPAMLDLSHVLPPKLRHYPGYNMENP